MNVLIEKMDHFGRGLGFINGKVIFIKNALPGELVSCKITKETKSYLEGEVIEYKNEIIEREKPICPYFNICGGCNLEHLSYENTLKFKKEKLANILTKNRIIFPNIEVIKNDSPYHYRNKLSLKIVDGLIGFYEESSHKLISIKYCYLAKASINEVLEKLISFQIKNGNITIRANYNDELLLIINTQDKINFDINNFKDLKVVGVILNDKTIYGENFFYERINGFLFKVSFDAFFQVNSFITKKLFEIIAENINGEGVVDLYSGVGTLGIVASKKSNKVYSIEIVKNAVLDNLENIKLNRVSNVYPILGDAKKALREIKDEYDTILIDPPRKGLDKNTRSFIMESNVKNIIYISCDPITLARDLLELTEKYEIKKIIILDMFSYTYHVECVCVLNRQ